MMGSHGMILVILGSVLLLLSFLLLWSVLMLLGAMQRNRLFLREGVVTIGEVVEQHTAQDGHGAVVFRFTAETAAGRVMQVLARENVWPVAGDAFTAGSRVFVEYVPRNPAVARLSPVCRTVPQMLA